MFGLGMWEILVILALALIFIGPKKLPELAQTLAKGLMEFRRATNEFKDTVNIDPKDEIKNSLKSLPLDSEVKIEEADTTTPDTELKAEKQPEPIAEEQDDIKAHLAGLDNEKTDSTPVESETKPTKTNDQDKEQE